MVAKSFRFFHFFSFPAIPPLNYFFCLTNKPSNYCIYRHLNGFILSFDNYDAFFADCEQTYKQLRQQGWRPEQARQVLPLGLKTQAVYTAFSYDWEHFIRLRADNVSGKAHPNIQLVAKKIKDIYETL